METPWGFGPGEYAKAEILPMHCFTCLCVISAWMLTTPFRVIVWNFMTEVCRVVCLNASMLATSLKMYQVVLSPRLQKLHGSAYAFALWGALFSVPELALKKNKNMYSKTRPSDTWLVNGSANYVLRLPVWCDDEDEEVSG
ncbi:hypothetical protein JG688_00012399 [Phytophthora aleatoria]|uniref:Transmembrane protein n=1 Tax=Phytophthora aleatoria TaxID=2496075 RepID=A0A8J5MED6_9STRA|nr:hypothetical protein JG688_00012399 [Phytophthora aleatoria]